MTIIATLTKRQYAALAPKVHANQKAGREGPNPRNLQTHPYPFPKVGNAETGLVEQYELLRDLPERFGAYLSRDKVSGLLYVSTWTGDKLGQAARFSAWRNNFGEHMEAGQVTIGGARYAWRGQGEGMYCSLRKLKGN